MGCVFDEAPATGGRHELSIWDGMEDVRRYVRGSVGEVRGFLSALTVERGVQYRGNAEDKVRIRIGVVRFLMKLIYTGDCNKTCQKAH